MWLQGLSNSLTWFCIMVRSQGGLEEQEWKVSGTLGWLPPAESGLLGIWLPTPIAITRWHPFQGSACANGSWCSGFSLVPWLPLVFWSLGFPSCDTLLCCVLRSGKAPLLLLASLPSSAYMASGRQNHDGIAYSWEEGSANAMDQLVFYVVWPPINKLLSLPAHHCPWAKLTKLY